MSNFGERSLGRLRGPRIKGVNTSHLAPNPLGEYLRRSDPLFRYKHPDEYFDRQDRLRAAQMHSEAMLQRHEAERSRLQAAGYVDLTLTCQACGADFVFSARDQDFYQQKGYTSPKRCATCRASSNRGSTYTPREPTHNDGFVDKQASCQDCGSAFTLSAGEQRFFHSKGFTEPKRCYDCRAKRKANK